MINKTILVGRLSKEVLFKQSKEGNVSATFTVAVSRNSEVADFIPCVAFGKTAELINNRDFKKGNMIAVEGHMQSGKYEKNGETRYTLECVVDKFVDPTPKSKTTPENDEDVFTI
jgi:single-strand DNA-binding protein